MDSSLSRAAGPKPPTQRKDYRRPRRRPAYLRTKTGCLTCRTRKKKCDETTRPCGNCARRQLTCHWPSGKPAGQDAVKYSTTASEAHTTSPNLQQNANLKVIEFDASHLSRSPTPTSCSSGWLPWSPTAAAVSAPTPLNAESGDDQTCIPYLAPPISWIYSTAITPDSVPLFDFLRAVFLPQLIRPTAQSSLIDFFSNESLAMALRVPFFMHSLLACCGAEILVEGFHLEAYFQRLAEVHYAKALAELRANLDADQMENHGTVILRTVIMLCIYERSKPYLSRGVDAHLLGMAQLINVRFQQPRQAGYRLVTDMTMDCVILEAFVFHASTSIPFQHQERRPVDIDRAFSLAEKGLEDECYRQIVNNSRSPILGVPPKLFAYIREITLMHQGLLQDLNVSRCYELIDELREMEACVFSNGHHSTVGVIPQGDYIDHEVSIGPRLYIVVAKLLLDRMISMASGLSAATALELVEEAIDLVKKLQPPTDYYAEYYGWPMQMLGAYASLPEHRICLLRKATEFWKATRNGTMGRLMRTLTTGSTPSDRPLYLQD